MMIILKIFNFFIDKLLRYCYNYQEENLGGMFYESSFINLIS